MRFQPDDRRRASPAIPRSSRLPVLGAEGASWRFLVSVPRGRPRKVVVSHSQEPLGSARYSKSDGSTSNSTSRELAVSIAARSCAA